LQGEATPHKASRVGESSGRLSVTGLALLPRWSATSPAVSTCDLVPDSGCEGVDEVGEVGGFDVERVAGLGHVDG
jgi:hypothetical protein